MSRSASRLDDDASPLGELTRAVLHAAGGAIARNPGAVAGLTAFVVALSFISANALWNQQQPHTTTFFVTREPAPSAVSPGPSSQAPVEPVEGNEVEATAAVQRRGDPLVERVQSMLIDLKLYTGSVDGIAGPQTRKAVEEYQKLAGLDVSGQIDERLLRNLAADVSTDGNEPAGDVAMAVPMPRPQPASARPVQSTGLSHDEVVRIQAGLKAFGHDGIEIDGLVGIKTKSAVREFQSLFGLPVTGEPDRALMDKMREIGLTN